MQGRFTTANAFAVTPRPEEPSHARHYPPRQRHARIPDRHAARHAGGGPDLHGPRDAGLADRARFVLQDYRDERSRYDGIVSIEMFEAVGERYWPAYFQTLRRCLKPDKIHPPPPCCCSWKTTPTWCNT